MKLASIAALLVVLAAVPASAQSAGSVSANVDIKRPVGQIPADLKCRLGLVNPRACVPSRAQPSARPSRQRGAAASPASPVRR